MQLLNCNMIDYRIQFIFVTLGVETDPNRAPDCDPNQCVLPDCFCSADGTRIPGGLEPSQVCYYKRIILLTKLSKRF